jgi:hypothetical protein
MTVSSHHKIHRVWRMMFIAGVLIIACIAYFVRVHIPEKEQERASAKQGIYYKELCESIDSINQQNLTEEQRNELKKECYVRFNARTGSK